MAKKQTGFTIVELLIVIVVIAILAAISIVAYTGIQDRANDSAVQNDLSSFGKNLLVFEVDNERYPTTTAEIRSKLSSISASAYRTQGNALHYCYNRTTGDVAIGGVSKSGKAFLFKNGAVTEVGTWPAMSAVAICVDRFGLAMPSGSITMYWRPDTSVWGVHTVI